MKKFLFFKSSSNGGEDHEMSKTMRDKKHYVETRWKTMVSGNLEKKFQNAERFSPMSERKSSERNTMARRSIVLRRSRSLSMSSGADENGRLGKEDLSDLRNRRKFPSSSNGASAPLSDCSEWQFQYTDRDSKPEKYNQPTIQMPGDEVLFDRACSVPSYSSSPQSSSGSTSIPGQVLDLYVDGEHHQQMKFGIGDQRSSKSTDLLKGRSHSSSNLFVSSHDVSRDLLGSKSQHESPRKLAKDVVEKLLKLEQFCDSKPGYEHLDGHRYFSVDGGSGKGSPCPDVNSEDNLSSKKRAPFLRRECQDSSSQKEDDTDSVLRRKLEETKQRAMILSRELSHDSSFEYYSSNLSALPMSRDQLEEERKLSLEISDQLQGRIAERTAARAAVAAAKEAMNSMVLKLKREKDELEYCFHRELDRRADEWASKVQELQSEERRLRDQERELSEQNVSLQKEVSSYYTKEQEYNDRLSQMQADLKDTRAKMDQARSDNEGLQRELSEIQDKLKVAEDTGSFMERNYKEKEKENTGLMKLVARLQGTCSQQERTIDGLRQSLTLETEKQQTSDKVGKLTLNLQMEQLRLTEVEQALRRQLETCRVESESLRHENIYLFERLNGIGRAARPSVLKLDQELESYIQCLNNMGLSLLNDSTQMCTKLLDVLKSKTAHDGFLGAHSLVEYDMKIQGFKQGAQQLERSLAKAASVLKEKGELESSVCYDSDSSDTSNGRFQNRDKKVLEDDLKSELKAECLLTCMLKERLYSKEKEIEQLQAELASALRNHDVLQSEIQGAFDTISCMNHKMKNLELEMIKKDGMIKQLEGEVWSQAEKLSSTKGVLSKVTQERDLMWEEVKQYSEKNMLLNCEINSLKKKIEALEEDTLLKDGQISILKDSLNKSQPFVAAFGLDHRENFRL
ncbi:hypothetical protein Cgig2_001367 [Carnegiea gigantea]|uniref:DUF7653 domain-containing protein n=1 Tax=Carnegiea gigantea TaxID=171969 RepID=A0A9Q1KRU7_9CARY|nr:hypothetical protein Cgig2_001367 [Carnegiea gigantea]